MKKNRILWLSSIILVYLIFYFHNLFSPNFPVTGTIYIDGKKVSYRLEKQGNVKQESPAWVRSDVEKVSGSIFWKYLNDSSYRKQPLEKNKEILLGKIPAQENLTSINYYLILEHENTQYRIPHNSTVNIKITGKVDLFAQIIYYFVMVLTFLLIIRTGMEYFNEKPNIKKLSFFTLSVLFVYAFAVEPLINSFELRVFDKYVPDVSKIFDLGPIVIFLLWVFGTILIFNNKKQKETVLAVSLLSIIIFIFFS